MKLVVISNPEELKGETELVTSLFENGLEYFHLRRPYHALKDMRKFIDAIPEIYHSKIIVHSNYKLLNYCNLKGIHFTRKTSDSADKFKNLKRHQSVSCHSLDEIKKYKGQFQYLFVSPVFDSISKKGHVSTISEESASLFFQMNKPQMDIIALGGIDENNIDRCRKIGFQGVAALGAIWDTFKTEGEDKALEKFNALRTACN